MGQWFNELMGQWVNGFSGSMGQWFSGPMGSMGSMGEGFDRFSGLNGPMVQWVQCFNGLHRFRREGLVTHMQRAWAGAIPGVCDDGGELLCMLVGVEVPGRRWDHGHPLDKRPAVAGSSSLRAS